MNDPKAIADSYISVWNESDPALRRQKLAHGWSADANYADPLMAAAGYDDISAMIEGARSQFPGYSFALTGTPDGHGAFVRFSWQAARDGEAPLIEGTDVVMLDGDGRIVEVVGFLDRVPAA
jgi:hypothetical protein